MNLTPEQTSALEVFTTRLIEEVSRVDEAAWTKPWAHMLVGVHSTNAATMSVYRGINQLMLSMTSLDHEWDTGWWAGVRQWNELGNYVMLNEHGTPGIRPEVWYRCHQCEKRTTVRCDQVTHDVEKVVKWRTFKVFHYCQTHGQWSPPPPRTPVPRIPDFERFVKNTQAEVVENDGIAALYTGSLDLISVPKAELFATEEHRVATLAHELGHWTGHDTRTKRHTDVVPDRGTVIIQRGMEEFVAELCAAYVTNDFDISGAVSENHTQYLAAWLENIKGKPADLLDATGYAYRAYDYLQSLQV